MKEIRKWKQFFSFQLKIDYIHFSFIFLPEIINLSFVFLPEIIKEIYLRFIEFSKHKMKYKNSVGEVCHRSNSSKRLQIVLLECWKIFKKISSTIENEYVLRESSIKTILDFMNLYTSLFFVIQFICFFFLFPFHFESINNEHMIESAYVSLFRIDDH